MDSDLLSKRTKMLVDGCRESRHLDGIDNIDSKNNTIIDNNDNNRYSLKNGFVPKTEETQTAREIAEGLHDSKNYALHRAIVKRIGSQRAYQCYRETLDDVGRGEAAGKPIKNPAALYNWKTRRISLKKSISHVTDNN